MIYTDRFNGLPVKTGDILCTCNGTNQGWVGLFWKLIGYLVPGPIDHVILYVGPDGRCVEAGGRGVIDFVMPDHKWDAVGVMEERLLVDTLVGISYPLQELRLSLTEEEHIRQSVADFCLDHVGKPYNTNFLNLVTNEAFYCSQLIYLAYRQAGINLGIRPIRTFSESSDLNDTPVFVLPTQLRYNFLRQKVINRLFYTARADR
jgi:hypothetical protein